MNNGNIILILVVMGFCRIVFYLKMGWLIGIRDSNKKKRKRGFIMGTRGTYGLYKNGESKMTYNHFDSYPDNLGRRILTFLQGKTLNELDDFFEHIEIIDESSIPTKEQKLICKRNGWVDLSVSNRNDNDWYCLLRKTQGDLQCLYNCLHNEYHKQLSTSNKVFMSNSDDFIKDSLFCEYAYIINLDDNILEFYVGFQREPQKGNRYGEKKAKNGYYPCRLEQTFDLEDICNNDNVISYIQWMEEVN